MSNCHYCQRRLRRYGGPAPIPPDAYTIDHKIPRSRLCGEHVPRNKVPCCHRCNGEKGPLTEVEYLAVRHDHVLLEDARKRAYAEVQAKNTQHQASKYWRQMNGWDWYWET